MKNQFLECGRVINKRGINGELKLECYCDSPESLKDVKILYGDVNGNKSYKVISVKGYKGFIFLKLDGISSPEDADLMRGKTLFVSRDDISIDDDSFFIADIIGLDVKDAATGVVYGKVKDVINYGASDIYVVSDGEKDYMLPAIDDIIEEIILESHILINPIQGIFDEAEEIR